MGISSSSPNSARDLPLHPHALENSSRRYRLLLSPGLEANLSTRLPVRSLHTPICPECALGQSREVQRNEDGVPRDSP